MNEFDSYKNDFGFEIGSGFSGNSDYMKALDEKKDVLSWKSNTTFFKFRN